MFTRTLPYPLPTSVSILSNSSTVTLELSLCGREFSSTPPGFLPRRSPCGLIVIVFVKFVDLGFIQVILGLVIKPKGTLLRHHASKVEEEENEEIEEETRKMRDCSTSFSGNMEDEYEKFIRRMNPPIVLIANKSCKNATIIQVDSANKHGILLEVVQVLTDLNFIVTKACISSNGGWFVDGS